MLCLGVIEETNSSWSSPVTLVQKGPKNRLCLDARKVNSRTIKDGYPQPHIEGLFEAHIDMLSQVSACLG